MLNQSRHLLFYYFLPIPIFICIECELHSIFFVSGNKKKQTWISFIFMDIVVLVLALTLSLVKKYHTDFPILTVSISYPAFIKSILEAPTKRKFCHLSNDKWEGFYSKSISPLYKEKLNAH